MAYAVSDPSAPQAGEVDTGEVAFLEEHVVELGLAEVRLGQVAPDELEVLEVGAPATRPVTPPGRRLCGVARRRPPARGRRRP